MSQIIYHKAGSLAWITLNDPERLNALTETMGHQLERLVLQINRDKAVRVVILTGAGRAFSAGGHLEMIVSRTQKTKAVNRRGMIAFYKQFLSLLKVEVPVIAMINGPAIGAAFCMTMACDLRIASTEAKFAVNFVKIGLSPGMGGTFLLPQLLGIPTAMDLLLTGRTLTAEEAHHKGIVHRIFTPEKLKEETIRLAEEIATHAPLALKIAKQGILAQLGGLKKAQLFEARAQAECFKSYDLLEGIEAVRAKRKPAFRGS